MRILIAEDEIATAKALKLLLEKAKYAVDIVHNGRDAWDMLAGGSYGGGFSFSSMPGGSSGSDGSGMPDMGSFNPGNMPDMGGFNPGDGGMPDMGNFDPGSFPGGSFPGGGSFSGGGSFNPGSGGGSNQGGGSFIPPTTSAAAGESESAADSKTQESRPQENRPQESQPASQGESQDAESSAGSGSRRPSSFSGMPGQSGSISGSQSFGAGSSQTSKNLLTYGICFGIMVAALLCMGLVKRKRSK